MDESAEQAAAVEQAQVAGIEIFHIQKGDTVIVRANASDQEQLVFITAAFGELFKERGLGPDDVSLLIIPANLDIAVLNKEQMAAMGWMRASRIRIAQPGNGIPH